MIARELKFNNAVLNFIMLDSMSFSATEELGYKYVILSIDSMMTPTSPKTLDRRMMEKYEAVMK